MDAPLTAPDALIRPWRTATLVASLVAAIELVLLVAAGLVLIAKPLSHAVQQHAQAAALKPERSRAAAIVKKLKLPPLKLTRTETGVFVLNGNGRSGAAATTASKLSALGYRVPATGNAKRQDYATTVVMFKRGFEAEAHRLARDMHVKVVGPLDGLAPSALRGGQLAILLGAS